MLRQLILLCSLCFSVAASAASPPGFVRVGNELKVVKDGGSGLDVRYLTSGNHLDTVLYATDHGWSKDGRFIYFESDRPHPQGKGNPKDWQLMAVEEATGEIYHVARIPFRPEYKTDVLAYHANLNPKNNQLFVVDRSGTRLYCKQLSTGGFKRVYTTQGETIIKAPPSFSADGRQLCLLVATPRGSDATHNGWTYEIRVLAIRNNAGDLNGERSLVTQDGLRAKDGKPEITLSHAAFRPTDSGQISYKRGNAVRTVRTNVQEDRQLYEYTGTGWRDHHGWSRNGESIQYVENGDLGRYRISDGNTAKYATDMAYDGWHQDDGGSGRIVFDHRVPDTAWDANDNRPGAIVLFDTATRSTRLLCSTVFSKSHPRHPHPQFSPDSTKVAFNTSFENRCRVTSVRVPQD